MHLVMSRTPHNTPYITIYIISLDNVLMESTSNNIILTKVICVSVCTTIIFTTSTILLILILANHKCYLK